MLTMEELITLGAIGCCVVPLILLMGWYFLLFFDNLMALTFNMADPRHNKDEDE